MERLLQIYQSKFIKTTFMKKALLSVAFALLAVTVYGKEGIYLEFKMTSSNMNGNSKSYSAAGDFRTEITMEHPGSGQPINITSLHLQSTPDVIYSINEKEKTYSKMERGKGASEGSDDDYDVTVLGKEKVNGFNCTHVTVKNRKTGRESEMWMSKDIPNYSSFTSVKTEQLGGAHFFNALKAKGADGFVARLVAAGGRGEKIQMDLVKAEKRDIPSSYFSLDGYKQTAATMPGTGMDIEALKKMTPEQRQKYIMEMRGKYQQQH